MHAPCRSEAIVRKLLILLPGLFVLTGAAAPSESPEGYWLTAKKDGIIQILRCGEALCGELAWFRIAPDDPNPQALDLRNPDPARRNRSLCGLTFMSGFTAAGPNSWEDGAVYDPDNGNTYHANMTLRPDGTLDLHGYIGISLFGRSEVWTRYTQPVPTCPTR
jgi:uncharacterized protein (DUF2147 family)